MTPDTLPGVCLKGFTSPGSLGVRAMLKELTDFVLALAKFTGCCSTLHSLNTSKVTASVWRKSG